MTWATLTPPERLIAVRQLVEAESLTYTEAADRLNTSRTAIAGVVNRAKAAGTPIRSTSGRAFGGGARPRKAKDPAVPKKPHQGFHKFVALDIPVEAVDLTPAKAGAWDPLDGSTPKPMSEHRTGMCLWAVGPDSGQFRFCCLPVQPGKQYCPTHFTLGNRPIAVGTSARRAPKSFKERVQGDAQ